MPREFTDDFFIWVGYNVGAGNVDITNAKLRPTQRILLIVSGNAPGVLIAKAINELIARAIDTPEAGTATIRVIGKRVGGVTFDEDDAIAA